MNPPVAGIAVTNVSIRHPYDGSRSHASPATIREPMVQKNSI